MSDTAADKQAQSEDYFAVVASVLDRRRVAINRGAQGGIKVGQRFLLYELSEEEIEDPITGRPLGRLEIPKGTGKVTHVQDQMAIIESDKQRRSSRQKPSGVGGIGGALPPLFAEEVFTTDEPVPFQSPIVGDPVKPV